MASTIMSLSLTEKEAQFIRKTALDQRRSKSGVVREALRQYELDQQWARIRERGRRTALEFGISSYNDVERIAGRHAA